MTAVAVLLGNGDGTFTAAAGGPVIVGSAPYTVAVGDVNGDGKLDLVTANYGSNTVTVLLGNGDGTFTAAAGSPVAAGSGPTSVALGELNGDGKLDLVAANSLSNNVTVLLNQATVLTVAGAGTGSGRVASSPAGNDCIISRGTGGRGRSQSSFSIRVLNHLSRRRRKTNKRKGRD